MAAVNKLKNFPELREIAVRGFRTKYHGVLKQSNSKIVSLKHCRSLLLCSLDEKVKNFIFAIRKEES